MEDGIMTYVKIENNIIVQKQPYAQEGFIEVSDDVTCGMVKNGDVFELPSAYIPTPAEIEADLDRVTDQLVLNDNKFRVMAELIFDVLKAVNTNDFSVFTGVTNKATFRAHVKERFRNL